MSNNARILLDRIHNEYHNRLDQDKKPEQSIAFQNDFFIKKYNYRENEFENLLQELADCGYISKWYALGFHLIID